MNKKDLRIIKRVIKKIKENNLISATILLESILENNENKCTNCGELNSNPLTDWCSECFENE